MTFINNKYGSDVSRSLGAPVYWFVRQKSGAQKTIFEFSLFFQLYFIKKYIDIAINDFTKHLIILKWLRRRMHIEEKTLRKKYVKAKEEIIYKSFISFTYKINHANACFFFLNSLCACSHSLNDANSLHCSLRFLLYYLCIFPAQIASQLSQVYHQKKKLFEYLNF